MAWRSGEQTLRAYEHLERSDSFQCRLRAIHQTMRRRDVWPRGPPRGLVRRRLTPSVVVL